MNDNCLHCQSELSDGPYWSHWECGSYQLTKTEGFNQSYSCLERELAALRAENQRLRDEHAAKVRQAVREMGEAFKWPTAAPETILGIMEHIFESPAKGGDV